MKEKLIALIILLLFLILYGIAGKSDFEFQREQEQEDITPAEKNEILKQLGK